MNWVWIALAYIDVTVLLAVQRGRVFCVEWFSWSVRGMERAGAVVYVLGMSLEPAFRWRTPAHLLLVAVISPIGVLLWWEARKTDHQRVTKLCMTGMAIFRVALLFWLPCLVALRSLPPRRWYDALPVIGQIAYTYVHFSTSLPIGGEPGRRRKLALAKVKEMFGTSWMPVPERG